MRRVMIGVVCVLLAALGVGAAQGIRAQSEQTETVRITVLYDNYLALDNLKADWGFAALVEYAERVVLFDTGADGSILLDNMEAVNIDPSQIDVLVLSHEHLDHLGGLAALFGAGARPDTVYVLPSFSASLKGRLAAVAEIVEVEPGREIVPGITTTGELTTGPYPEQALLIDTADGIVVMTGCAHPGIVSIVRTAVELTDRPIALVMGGFHLEELGSRAIGAILRDFRALGVARVAPSHCTGARAIRIFEQDYGEAIVALGVGSILEFSVPGPLAE